MATVLSTAPKLGDILIWELAPEYNRESITLTNDEASEIDLDYGHPLIESGGTWTPAVQGEENAVDGLLAEEVKALAASATKEVKILKRGPAVINIDKVPDNDVADAAFNKTTLQTRLEALSPPFVVRSEPTVVSTQTT